MDQMALTKFKEEIMSLTKFDSSKFSEKTSVSFSGSPMPHPYDSSKFILICDPLSEHTEFLEFNKSDVTKIEDATSVTTDSGKSLRFLRVWIKEGVIAVKYHPFVVAKTKNIFDKKNS